MAKRRLEVGVAKAVADIFSSFSKDMGLISEELAGKLDDSDLDHLLDAKDILFKLSAKYRGMSGGAVAKKKRGRPLGSKNKKVNRTRVSR